MLLKTRLILRAAVMGMAAWLAVLVMPAPAHAEYGDVVINNFSDAAGMRPAVFSHWFHRVRFRCKVCHADLGFQFKAGATRSTWPRSSMASSAAPAITVKSPGRWKTAACVIPACRVRPPTSMEARYRPWWLRLISLWAAQRPPPRRNRHRLRPKSDG